MREVSEAARTALSQLFLKGPTWDGDIVSKEGRDELFKMGLVNRYRGWAFITRAGVDLALDRKLGDLKQSGRY